MASRLIKRLWFYGTWVRLAVWGVFAPAFIGMVGYVGLTLLTRDPFGVGLLFVGLSTALLLLFLKRVLTFRRHLGEGIMGELKRRNYCPHCEYDLRSSVGRCPECGEDIAGRSDTIEI